MDATSPLCVYFLVINVAVFMLLGGLRSGLWSYHYYESINQPRFTQKQLNIGYVRYTVLFLTSEVFPEYSDSYDDAQWWIWSLICLISSGQWLLSVSLVCLKLKQTTKVSLLSFKSPRASGEKTISFIKQPRLQFPLSFWANMTIMLIWVQKSLLLHVIIVTQSIWRPVSVGRHSASF